MQTKAETSAFCTNTCNPEPYD